MNISKIVLILLVLNIKCFASNGEEAIQQPAPVQASQAQSSFWSYFKYLDPYYYWQKYRLRRLNAEIKATEEKVIKNFNEGIATIESDIAILKGITNVDELNQNKAKLQTSLVLHQLKNFGSNLQGFLDQKQQIIQELERDVVVLGNLRDQFHLSQEIAKLEEKRKELQQRIEDNK